MLARPGEGYFDRAQGRLLLVPREGDSIASTEVVVPRLAQVLRLAGRPDDGRFVERVVLRGLGLAHTEAPCPPLGPPNSDLAGPPQAAVTSPGSVFAEGARECSFEDCELVHLGGYGIELAGGCTGCRIVDCEIHDLAAGAIKLGETGIRKEAAWRSGDHLVADNHLHDGGLRHHSAVGIWVGQSGGNRIEHNHIHHFFYTGISLGWTWGYGQSACAGNAIEKNSVHDIGMGLLSDMGGIYTLGVSPGTVIRGNVFHDVESYSYGGWGIYFDEGTTGVVAENNIVYRCKSNGFHQHYGKENVVRNNVFAASRDAQIARTRAEPHLSFTFERNLVWWNSGKLLSGDWSGAGFRRDHNLYFDARTPTADKQQVLGSAGTAGQDASSIVADPLFEDPLHGDFRLRPHSPALGLAFVPIDCSDVGPRPRPRR